MRAGNACGSETALFVEELKHIARAGAKRRAEFAAGRILARRVLQDLGIAPCALPATSAGAPKWPAGVKGSLSHATGHCLVAATRNPQILTVGLDLETDLPLAREVEALTCTPRERAWIRQLSGQLREAAPALLFSAKEAFYKCQHPITGLFIDFLEVELEFDVVAQTFTVQRLFGGDADRELFAGTVGRFRLSRQAVVTSAVMYANLHAATVK